MLMRASHFARRGDLKAKGRQLEGQLENAARQTLEEADQKYEQGQYVEALRDFQVLAKLKKLDVAIQAEQRIAEARQDPELRNHMLDARAAVLFEKVEQLQSRLSRSCQGDPNPSVEFDEEVALSLLEVKPPDCDGCEDCRAWVELTPEHREARILADQIEMVWVLEKIVTRYGETPTGIKSARLLRGLLADEAFSAEVDRGRVNEEASKTYMLAKSYAQSQVNEQAAELMRRLLDYYGETQWAEKARDDLKENVILASLVAQTKSLASDLELPSVAARLREKADGVLVRVATQPTDMIDRGFEFEQGSEYQRLVELIGPSLINAARQSIPTTSLAKKQRVLLYYSASWCGPCNIFTPKLKAFYEANKSEDNFEVVLVSSDATTTDMHRYMTNHKMPWLAVPMNRLKESGLIDEFDVNGIPHLVLIDQSGLVLSNSVANGRYIGPDNVLSYLKTKIDMASRRDI